METSSGAPGAPRDPTSTGAGIGVVGGYLPLTQGNQTSETPLLIPKQYNSWERLIDLNQGSAETLQASLLA
jgi:hypothetical protein